MCNCNGSWIIIIILLLICCGGWGNFGTNTAKNNGCGCGCDNGCC